MGKEAHSGPLYGAKSLLWSFSRATVGDSTVAASTAAKITVPPGENWVITDFHVYRGSTHSTAFTAALLDDSTSIASIAITSSLAEVEGSTRIAPTGGEYSGIEVLTGSVLSISMHNGGSSVASTAVVASVFGFQRWLQSSTLGQGPGN